MHCRDYLGNHDMEIELNKQLQEDTRSAAAEFAAITPTEYIDGHVTINQLPASSFKRVLSFDGCKENGRFRKQELLVNAIESILDRKSNDDLNDLPASSFGSGNDDISGDIIMPSIHTSRLNIQGSLKSSERSSKYDIVSNNRDAGTNSNKCGSSNHKNYRSSYHTSDENQEVFQSPERNDGSNIKEYESVTKISISDSASNDYVHCQCRDSEKEVEQLKKQMIGNFQILKMKVMSTNELISEHHKKCADLESEEKIVKDIKEKLEGCYGETGVLRIQLQKALQANEPLKRTIRRFEYEKSVMQQSINDLKLELGKAEVEINDLKQAVDSSRSAQEKYKTLLDDKGKESEKDKKKLVNQAKAIDRLNKKLNLSNLKLRDQRKALKKVLRENQKLRSGIGKVKVEKNNHKQRLSLLTANFDLQNISTDQDSKKPPIGILSPSPSPPPSIPCHKKIKKEMPDSIESEQTMLWNSPKLESASYGEIELHIPQPLVRCTTSQLFPIPTLLSPPLSPIPPSPISCIYRERTLHDSSSLLGNLIEVNQDNLSANENIADDDAVDNCGNISTVQVEVNPLMLNNSFNISSVNGENMNSKCDDYVSSLLDNSIKNHNLSLFPFDEKIAGEKEDSIQNECIDTPRNNTQCDVARKDANRFTNFLSSHNNRENSLLTMDSCCNLTNEVLIPAMEVQEILVNEKGKIIIEDGEIIQSVGINTGLETGSSSINELNSDIKTIDTLPDIINSQSEHIPRLDESMTISCKKSKFKECLNVAAQASQSTIHMLGCKSLVESNYVKYSHGFDGKTKLTQSSIDSKYVSSILKNDRSRKRKQNLHNTMYEIDLHSAGKVIVCGANDPTVIASYIPDNEPDKDKNLHAEVSKLESTLKTTDENVIDLLEKKTKLLAANKMVNTECCTKLDYSCHCAEHVGYRKEMCDSTNSDRTSKISLPPSACSDYLSLTSSCYLTQIGKSMDCMSIMSQCEQESEMIVTEKNIPKSYHKEFESSEGNEIEKDLKIMKTPIFPSNDYPNHVNAADYLDFEVASFKLPTQYLPNSHLAEPTNVFSGISINCGNSETVVGRKSSPNVLNSSKCDSVSPDKKNDMEKYAEFTSSESFSKEIELTSQLESCFKCEKDDNSEIQGNSKKINSVNGKTSSTGNSLTNADDLDHEVASFELSSKHQTTSNTMEASNKFQRYPKVNQYKNAETSCVNASLDTYVSQPSNAIHISCQLPFSSDISQPSSVSTSYAARSTLNAAEQANYQSYLMYSSTSSTISANRGSHLDATVRPLSPVFFSSPSPPLSPIPPSPRGSLLTPMISPLPTTPLPESVSPLPPSPKITSPPLIRGSALLLTEDPSLFVPTPHKKSAIMALKFGQYDTSNNNSREVTITSGSILVASDCTDQSSLGKSDDISRLLVSDSDKVSSNFVNSDYSNLFSCSDISIFPINNHQTSNSYSSPSCRLHRSITQLSCYPYNLDERTVKSNLFSNKDESVSALEKSVSNHTGINNLKSVSIKCHARTTAEPSTYKRPARSSKNVYNSSSFLQSLNSCNIQTSSIMNCKLNNIDNKGNGVYLVTNKKFATSYSSSTITRPGKQFPQIIDFNTTSPTYVAHNTTSILKRTAKSIVKSKAIFEKLSRYSYKKLCKNAKPYDSENVKNRKEKKNCDQLDDASEGNLSITEDKSSNFEGSNPVIRSRCLLNSETNAVNIDVNISSDEKINCQHKCNNTPISLPVAADRKMMKISCETDKDVSHTYVETTCDAKLRIGDKVELSTSRDSEDTPIKNCNSATQLTHSRVTNLLSKLPGPLSFNTSDECNRQDFSDNIDFVDTPDFGKEEELVINDDLKMSRELLTKEGETISSHRLNPQNIMPKPSILRKEISIPLLKKKSLKIRRRQSELNYATEIFQNIRNQSISKKDAIILLDEETNLSDTKSLSKAVVNSLLDCERNLLPQILKNLDNKNSNSVSHINEDNCSFSVNPRCSECTTESATFQQNQQKCKKCEKLVLLFSYENVKNAPRRETFHKYHPNALNCDAPPLLTMFENDLLDVLMTILSTGKFEELTLLDELQSKMLSVDGMLTCQRLSLCRIFAAVCRLYNKVDRLQGFMYSLGYDQLLHISYPMFFITCYSIWPSFLTRTDLILKNEENTGLLLYKIKLSPLSAVLQFIALSESVEKKESTSQKILENILSITLQNEVSSQDYYKQLINELIDLLSNMEISFIKRFKEEIEICSFAFSCIKAIGILCKRIGWEWTYNKIFCDRIWSVLKNYASGSVEFHVDSIAIFIQLSGYLSQYGIVAGFKDIHDYSQLLADILNEISSSDIVLDSLEISIVYTLLNIAPSCQYICQSTLKKWLEKADERNFPVPATLYSRISDLANQFFERSRDGKI